MAYRSVFLWAVGCGVLGVTGATDGQITIRTVALSGQAAPGVANRTLSAFGPPSVGSTGQIWYTAGMTGPGPGPASVLYRADAGPSAGPPTVVYANADQVPGLVANRVWTGSWGNLVAGTAGEIMFSGGVLRTDIGGTYTGLFRTNIDGNSLVVYTDGPNAPGRALPFGGFTYVAGATGGNIAIRADVTGGGNNTGLWSNTGAPSGDLGLLAFEGDPADLMPAGVNWGDLTNGVVPNITPFVNPVVNSGGFVAFKAPLAGAVTTNSNEGIWYGLPGLIIPVVREGDPVQAAGAPAGATWLMFDAPSINAQGKIVFSAMMTGGGTTGANDEAIFYGSPSAGGTGLAILVRENDPCPGLPGFQLHERDSALRSFRSVVINNAGQIAFITGIASAAGITNSNDSLAYVWTPNPQPPTPLWTLVGREGEQAAGALSGELYGNFNELGISSAGDIAFSNALGGVNRALFAGPLGQHGLIARRNGTVQVAPGDMRTIGVPAPDFQFSIVTGGSDGRATSLSKARTVAFRARFTNGTEGIFEAALGPVPPPPGDRDGDGLRDDWETGPMDINEDGIDDLNLAALGANPDRLDAFLEIDRQNDVPLPQSALDLVVNSFAVAPLVNPVGPEGITLHLMLDDTFPGPAVWATPQDAFPTDYQATKTAYFGTAADRASPNSFWRKEARRRTMRYSIVVSQVTGNQFFGLAETPGNDMVLVFNRPRMATDEAKAATLMHEFGHNLGLRHGGGEPDNFKPNYPSLMNYVLTLRYPFNQLFFRMDYCREALPMLNEWMLNEQIGVGSPTSLYANTFLPAGYSDAGGVRRMKCVRLNGSPTDFASPDNHRLDGQFTTDVSQDLNRLGVDCPVPGSNADSFGQFLNGYNDWAIVSLRIPTGGPYAAGALVEPGLYEPNDALADWIELNVPLPPGVCPADVDGNGLVQPADVAVFVNTWFTSLVQGTLAGDFDGNGIVQPADIAAYINVWLAAVMAGGC